MLCTVTERDNEIVESLATQDVEKMTIRKEKKKKTDKKEEKKIKEGGKGRKKKEQKEEEIIFTIYHKAIFQRCYTLDWTF